VAGDPLFRNPSAGDFSISEFSPARRTGFSNFDMTGFGVVSPGLREKAAAPQMPKLNILSFREESDTAISWRGSEIKKLKGMGEMSATGMTSESGILITKINADSPLKGSGLKVNDVIIKVNGNPVNSLQQFFYYYE
jgi:S1-C subfamily serine protease